MRPRQPIADYAPEPIKTVSCRQRLTTTSQSTQQGCRQRVWFPTNPHQHYNPAHQRLTTPGQSKPQGCPQRMWFCTSPYQHNKPANQRLTPNPFLQQTRNLRITTPRPNLPQQDCGLPYHIIADAISHNRPHSPLMAAVISNENRAANIWEDCDPGSLFNQTGSMAAVCHLSRAFPRRWCTTRP